MTEIPQDAEDQIDAAAQAVALGVAQLIADVMGGKKRVSVISGPMLAEGPGGVAWRHSIDVADADPVAHVLIQSKMYDALVAAEAQFLMYARNHEAKGAAEKAATNLEMASTMRNALNFALDPLTPAF